MADYDVGARNVTRIPSAISPPLQFSHKFVEIRSLNLDA